MSLPLWQPLASTNADQTSTTSWYWLPGWSFATTVFADFLATLPGQHWGLNWDAAAGDFQSFAEQLAASAQPGAIWIGWSLGGALAMRAAHAANARSVLTIATGQQFCKPDNGSDWGMDPAVFEAFQQGLAQQPEKTLKRFLGLCAQGSDERKTLANRLAEYQLSPEGRSLGHSLAWLGEYNLEQDQRALQAAGIPQLHLYASADSLTPGGLQPARGMGQSHALLLETVSHNELASLFETLGQDH